MHLVNGDTYRVAGVINLACLDAIDRGYGASSAGGDGLVCDPGGQQLLQFGREGDSVHRDSPSQICTFYALMHTSQRISPVFRYASPCSSITGMHKKTIRRILADLIAAEGIRPTELARRAGINQSTLSRILSGKIEEPTDKQVHALADYFRVSTDQLRGRAPMQPRLQLVPSEKPLHSDASPIHVWDDETPLGSDEVEVPFLREVELAAGSGRSAIRESDAAKLRFGARSLRKHGVQPENAVCVTVSGNSMEPVLRNGATVGVDRGRQDIVDGDMYAINHDGQLRVKQVYRLPGGGLRLRSFNRDEHPDEEYRHEEVREQGIAIIGRVFWWGMFA